MKCFSNVIKHIYLFIFLINISFTNENSFTFHLTSERKEKGFEILHFKFDNDYGNWIPSLFSPMLLVSFDYNTQGFIYLDFVEIKTPLFTRNIDVTIYKNENLFLFKKFNNLLLGKIETFKLGEQYYFRLSPGIFNCSNGLKENQNLLNQLKENNEISKKIFSFDKWEITPNNINSYFYLGDEHEHFKSKNGIIGTCKSFDNDPLFGCSFHGMIFNNNFISFINSENNQLYKIYFSSESYSIVFPHIFRPVIFNITKDLCNYSLLNKYFICNNFFNDSSFIPLKLIKEDMNITIEIDNGYRFYLNNEDNEEIINIQFSDIEYIILPLIMFKNFHIQFDAEKNLISFYTNDYSILEVKKENENNSNNKGFSIGLIILIIIIIILVILIVGYFIFRFLRKNKNQTSEKDMIKIDKLKNFLI